MFASQALYNLVAAITSFNTARVLSVHNIANKDLHKLIAIGLYLLHFKRIIVFYNFVYALQ